MKPTRPVKWIDVTNVKPGTILVHLLSDAECYTEVVNWTDRELRNQPTPTTHRKFNVVGSPWWVEFDPMMTTHDTTGKVLVVDRAAEVFNSLTKHEKAIMDLILCDATDQTDSAIVVTAPHPKTHGMHETRTDMVDMLNNDLIDYGYLHHLKADEIELIIGLFRKETDHYAYSIECCGIWIDVYDDRYSDCRVCGSLFSIGKKNGEKEEYIR